MDKVTETNSIHYVRRPQALPIVSVSEGYPRSLADFVIPAMLVGVAVFSILAIVGIASAVMSDGTWTDPSTGCRYRVGYGDNTSYTALLLPNGLPDCRVVVKP